MMVKKSFFNFRPHGVRLGDFRSQVGAAYNSWRKTGALDANIKDNLFFRRLRGFSRINVAKYRIG